MLDTLFATLATYPVTQRRLGAHGDANERIFGRKKITTLVASTHFGSAKLTQPLKPFGGADESPQTRSANTYIPRTRRRDTAHCEELLSARTRVVSPTRAGSAVQGASASVTTGARGGPVRRRSC